MIGSKFCIPRGPGRGRVNVLTTFPAISLVCKVHLRQSHPVLDSYPPRTTWQPFRRRYFQMHFRDFFFNLGLTFHWCFIPKGAVNNNQALVQIMARRRIGDEPVSEPMLTRFKDIYAALEWDEFIRITDTHRTQCAKVIGMNSAAWIMHLHLAKQIIFRIYQANLGWFHKNPLIAFAIEKHHNVVTVTT